MEMENEESKWPKEIGFSMSPDGYVVSVRRTKLTEDTVSYTCYRDKCLRNPFTISIDPRDMSLESVKQMMRWHVDEEH